MFNGAGHVNVFEYCPAKAIACNFLVGAKHTIRYLISVGAWEAIVMLKVILFPGMTDCHFLMDVSLKKAE